MKIEDAASNPAELVPDGGRAFPNTEVWHPTNGEPLWQGAGGMSLRDYLAAKCMQSLVNAQFLELGDALRLAAEKHGSTKIEYMAKAAYEYADAMLKVRKG